MKGMVFTEFLDLIESRYGLAVVEEIIDKSNLANKGAYTSIGTYDHSEMFSLITHLSQRTGTNSADILKWFGQHLFVSFSQGYPMFFKDCNSTYAFLLNLESYVHREVRKLYPDAELPRFETEHKGDHLTMIYKSERGMAALAEGLIMGCIAHFKEDILLHQKDVSGNGKEVHFFLTKNAA